MRLPLRDQLRLSLLALAAGGVVTGVWLLAPSCPAAAAPAAPGGPALAARDARAGVPVLVELFTSEGCSSCPPAEEVLARLDRVERSDGALVVPLAHHVDYWDGLGWPDPLASAEATARQRAYAPLRSGSYTPQAVVDGTTDVVGSRERALEQAIADAAKRPHLPLELRIHGRGDGGFDVVVRATVPTDADLVLATVQDQARVAVPRGENAGRTLEHVAVVRSLRVLSAPEGVAKTSVIPPKPIAAIDPARFSLVAFIQERASRRVLGSARAALEAAR